MVVGPACPLVSASKKGEFVKILVKDEIRSAVIRCKRKGTGKIYFQLWEVGIRNRDRLWIRGGLPRAFLADSESESIQWREGFVRTFLERDIPQLGITIAAETLRRFWTMVAHYHGQVWKASP